MANPYRIPDAQILPEPLDFAYAVFSTDMRLIHFAREKFEVIYPASHAEDDDGTWQKQAEALLRQAVLRLWHMAKEENELPQRGHKKSIQLIAYQEAQILSERVGRRWDSTPIPTLVEALSDDELLHCFGFPRITLEPESAWTVMTHVYVNIRPSRLVLGDEETCSKIGIADIRIGKNSFFANAHTIPGCCFSNRAFPYRLRMDTASVSQTISLYLINHSKNERVEVQPMMYGVVRQSDW